MNFKFKNNCLSECPPDWIDGRSEGLGCLYFTNDKKRTWNDSKTYCATLNDAYLVEIFNASQQTFIIQEASKIGSGYDWWIGLTDFEGILLVND